MLKLWGVLILGELDASTALARLLTLFSRSIDMLDVIRQEEEEAKPDLAVKEEMAMES